MSELERAAATWSPLVCRISVNDGTQDLGAGTGFITRHGVVTASHVVTGLPSGRRARLVVGSAEWELPTEELRARVKIESPEHRHDFAVISVVDAPPPFSTGTMQLAPPDLPPVGRHVAYLGHPFGSPGLVVSSGYVSSVEATPAGVVQLRVDGSVNRGNSGGPLIDLVTGQVVAVVTRAATGFLVDQMQELKNALAGNLRVLERVTGGMSISGVDPIDATRAAMAALLAVTEHIERSANVGIGYAFGLEELVRVIGLEDAAET